LGELIKGKHLGKFSLMPAAPGTCPVCGVTHNPKQHHNQQSLFYQYNFYNEYGRWPTWKDAMEHCSDEVKAFWIKEL
jgi:hypothetical protein